MTDVNNPYVSPRGELGLAKDDTATHEVVHKLGDNTYLWENRRIRIAAEPIAWFQNLALFAEVDGSQKFSPKRMDQLLFYIVGHKREVPIQVDFLIPLVPWKRKFNLFVGDQFIDQSVVPIRKWWRPWVFAVVILVVAIVALSLRAKLRTGTL